MTRAAVAVLVAVVLGMTATPADARPLHTTDDQVAPVTACARIVMTDDGEVGDCAVHYCRRHRHGHRKHVGRKHRHHRSGCLNLPATIQGS